MDYSKFDKISDEAEAEAERKAEEEDAKRAKEVIEKARKTNSNGQGESTDDEDSEDDMCPLFWTKPPSMRKNPSKKALEMQELLEQMTYDRPPEELAEDFKERGNISFKQNKYKDAISLYSEALEWAHKAWTKEKDMSDLIGTILSNRSAVEMKQKNYRTTIKEAEASLKASASGPSANKARIRGARACLNLKRPDEALKKFLPNIHQNQEQQLALTEASTDDDEESKKRKEKIRTELSELAAIVKEAHAMRETLLAQAAEKNKALVKDREEEAAWRTKFAHHGIRLGPLTMDLQPITGGSEKTGSRGPNPKISDDGIWAWQTVFIYPEHSQTELVQAFEEHTTFIEMLNTMFPPVAQEPVPWDPHVTYSVGSMEVFFRERATVPFDLTRPLSGQSRNIAEEEEKDMAKRRWFRIPLSASLGAVLRNHHYVIPGLPVFVIVTKASPAYYKLFIDSCKQKDGPVVDLKL